MMSSPILANTSQRMPIINSPNHGFASLGLLCKRQIILKWISLNDLATILLKGNKHCAFANLDQLQYLSSRISTALSSSLKKLFTSRINCIHKWLPRGMVWNLAHEIEVGKASVK